MLSIGVSMGGLAVSGKYEVCTTSMPMSEILALQDMKLLLKLKCLARLMLNYLRKMEAKLCLRLRL